MVTLTSLSNTEILGLTIIGEARGEKIEGQVGVGNVIRNRLQSNPIKYKSYHDVCLEPKQFSCWNKNDPNYEYLLGLAGRIINNQERQFNKYLQQCMFVAQGIHEDLLLDNTGKCKFYMTINLFRTNRPGWAENAIKVREIGNHIFFDLR